MILSSSREHCEDLPKDPTRLAKAGWFIQIAWYVIAETIPKAVLQDLTGFIP